MAPSQALFPFNRFTGGRKPKLPCRGSGDEITPVPACCLPAPTISSPPGASPRAGTRGRGRTGAAAARLKSPGMKEVPAECSPQPSQPGPLDASQKTIKKIKRKPTFFQRKPLIHPRASPPQAMVCACAPRSSAARGTPSPPSITAQWRPGSWLGRGMLQQHEIPFRKKPGFRKKYFNHPKSRALSGGAPAHCSLGSFV